MKRKMFLRLLSGEHASEGNELQCSWLVFDGDGQNEATVHSGRLKDVAEDVATCIVTVFVPAEDVLLMTVNVPSRNRKDIINAIPYALEDRLAEDIEDLHFAVGERSASEDVPVAIIADDKMSGWLQSLRDVGIEPAILTTELFGLASQTQHWSILLEDNKVLLRNGTQSGFAMDAESMVEHLPKAWLEREGQHSTVINVIDVRSRTHVQSSVDEPLPWESLLAGADIDYKSNTESALQMMAKNFDASAAINLIQGQHSRQEQLGRILRPWSATAVLFVLLLIVGGGKTLAEYFYLSDKNEMLAVNIESIYRQAFPEAKRVVNARIQMQQKLDALKDVGGASNSGFLSLLSNVGMALKTHPAEITRLVYRNKNFDVAMTMSDMQLLEKMESSLEQDGTLGVEIRSATQKNGKVEAQIKIKRNTP